MIPLSRPLAFPLMAATFSILLTISSKASPKASNTPSPSAQPVALESAERPLAPHLFSEKEILPLLAKEVGTVTRYRIRINKGWLDKNRLSITIAAEVRDNQGDIRLISQDAIATLREGMPPILTKEKP